YLAPAKVKVLQAQNQIFVDRTTGNSSIVPGGASAEVTGLRSGVCDEIVSTRLPEHEGPEPLRLALMKAGEQVTVGGELLHVFGFPQRIEPRDGESNLSSQLVPKAQLV